MKSRLLNISDTVVLDEIEYKINTDFWVWIEIEGLLFDTKTDPLARLAKVLCLAYPALPQNPYNALQGVLDFYMIDGGKRLGEEIKETYSAVAPSFDIREDFDYIWGAFMSEYGIDLTESHMHWWKFMTLLACLSEGCKFSKIVGFRTTDTSVIKDKGVRQFYEKMKKQFSLMGKDGALSGEEMVASSLEGLF